MRILQVVHNFLPYGAYGGVEVSTDNLCKELSKSHEIQIFCRGGTYFKKRLVETNEIYNGFQVKRIFFQDDVNFQGISGKNLAEKAFRQVIAKQKPDVIHFQHLIGLSPDFISIAKMSGIPTVLHLHDYWYFCPNIKLLFANNETCEGPGDQSRCVLCQQAGGFEALRSNLILSDLLKIFLPKHLAHNIAENRRFRILKKVRNLGCNLEVQRSGNRETITLDDLRSRNQKIREKLQQVDVIIANSDFVREKYVEWGLPASKVHLVYFGHDFSYIESLPKKHTDGIKFGYLGDLTIPKGVDILIKAFSQLKDHRSSLSLHGKCEPEFNSYLHSLAGGENVRFEGRYSPVQLSEIFSNIDVLIVPSIWQEAYGLVISEAFMAKVPIVASRVGGIPEHVIHGVNGLLFEPGNVEQLLGYMQRIVGEPDLLGHLKLGITPPKTIQEYAQEIERIYYSLQEGACSPANMLPRNVSRHPS